ncbi:hypothetical protein B0O99DRAFT_624485 [Bisporella sp. PMI_857]|nr:hypothetical protein B0O99DRAFT_624485 [Bisporella sp. PMI_857]
MMIFMTGLRVRGIAEIAFITNLSLPLWSMHDLTTCSGYSFKMPIPVDGCRAAHRASIFAKVQSSGI